MAYLKGHWQLLIILVVVFALWSTPIVIPLKILIVFLHELSHAAMTWATGGEVMEMSISAQQGGHVISRGGSRFLILTAGYLGSLLMGVGLLMAALRSTADRMVVALFGAMMILVALLYMRDFFALGFTLATGVALLVMSRFLSNNINDMTLRLIGLSSLIYVPYDIFDDTIRRANLRSDAYMLAEEFGGPTMMWGALWLILSAVVIFWCLRHVLGQDSNLRFASFRKSE